MDLTLEQVEQSLDKFTQKELDKLSQRISFVQAEKEVSKKKAEAFSDLLTQIKDVSTKFAQKQGLTLSEFSSQDPYYTEVELEKSK